jgi:hypothetical protein
MKNASLHRSACAIGLLALALLAPCSALGWSEHTVDAAVGATVSEPPDASHSDTATMGRLRANLTGSLYGESSSPTWEAAYEVVGFMAETLGNSGIASGALPKLRVADLEHELSSGTHHFVGQNLDRLSVRYDAGGGTFTVGRQGVGHGSGRFFNPSDIFSPVAPQATYSEYKSGIDGVRFTRAVGEDSEWEVYGFVHEEGKNSYALLRGRTKLGPLDVSGYGGLTLDAPTLGLDLALDLLGAGWYLDGVARLDRSFDSAGRVAVGAHHRFPWGMNALVEFHFNGPGHKNPEQGWRTFLTPEGQNGELFLTARRYLAAEADYEVHPLVTAVIVTVLNLDDSSTLLQPSVDWSATEEVSVAFGASLGFGEAPDGYGFARSEFGSYPNLLFVEARTSF